MIGRLDPRSGEIKLATASTPKLRRLNAKRVPSRFYALAKVASVTMQEGIGEL